LEPKIPLVAIFAGEEKMQGPYVAFEKGRTAFVVRDGSGAELCVIRPSMQDRHDEFIGVSDWNRTKALAETLAETLNAKEKKGRKK
jgi:hypothetical protein